MFTALVLSATASVAPTSDVQAMARHWHDHDGRLSRVYGAHLARGASPEASTAAFLDQHLSLWNITPGDLEPVGPFPTGQHTANLMFDADTGAPKFTAYYWRQVRDGYPVHDTRLMLLVRHIDGSPVVQATADLRDLGDYQPQPATVAPHVTAQRAAHVLLGSDAVVLGDVQTVIWAGDGDPRLAVDAVIQVGTNGEVGYDKRRVLIDAHHGTVLVDEPRILNCGIGAALATAMVSDVTGRLVARAGDGWSAQECDPMSTQGMAWTTVTAGGETTTTDADGYFTLPTSGAVTLRAAYDGPYFHVNVQQGSDSEVTADAQDGDDVELMLNESESEFTTAEANAYIHANACRDFILHYNPEYPVIHDQLGWPINVNISDSCNAYYDYSSINFYASGGSCNNTAYGHVVHHEYGHHLIASAGSGQGEYGEGMSDCIAVIMTGDPRMGPGFYAGNCAAGIRNADNNCQQTSSCSSCGSAIHSCGQLMSGCVWSTWQYLIDADPLSADDIIASLTINSILLHTGTSINDAIAIDFLTLDDNDGDISNGTPNYDAIASGFGDHSVNAPPIAWLNLSLVNGEPTHCSPAGGTAVQFRVDPGLADPDLAATQVLAGSNGSFSPAPVTDLGDGLFECVLPGTTCGEYVEWFILAQTQDGNYSALPVGAPSNRFHTIATWSEPVIAFDDDCSTDPGWTVGGDATDGFWERGIPAGGNNRPQTDCDEAASYCWVTENTAGGGGDVDGGSTTLTSPTIDATGVQEISYCWWYRNIGGGSNVEDDIWQVYVSDDDGATWHLLQETGTTGPDVEGNWQTSVFSLTAIPEFEITDAFRIRFVASDLNETSRVEAAIDNVRMVAIDCESEPCTGDVDGDGMVGADDILAILSGWGDCPDCPADLDGNGVVDVDDLLTVISGFGPC